jgi:DNA polymerase
MSDDAYSQLLDATIAHLEGLRERGMTFVPVDREALSTLASPARAAAAVPAAPARQNARPAPGEPAMPSAAPSVHVVPSAAALSRWSNAASPMPAKPRVPPPSPSPPSPPPADKEAAMAALRRKALACTRCPHLVAARNTVVFGVGDVNARVLFVGEAPGADEDARGEPFVGKAGELLTKMIVAMGLSRETVFIANILKCRPDTPGQTSGNRKPRPDEMSTCIPWLEEQIHIIRPRVMVALGATAVEGLLGMASAGITRLRGQWQEYRGTPLMPTYHPAYLLRNQAVTEKRKVWEDMLQVMEKAGYPVSTKQRGFFLTKG